MKKEIDKEKNTTAIGQGYNNKTSQSSRRAWRADTTKSSYIKTILPLFQKSVEHYFTSNDLDYKVSFPSVLQDEGEHPHIQAPHVDYDPNAVGKLTPGKDELPVVVLYAIEEFTVVVFLKGPQIFGSTFGTRIKVPKGCAIVMAANLYHSGDVFFDSNNLRMHGYCVPTTVEFPLFELDTVYREGRRDITRVPMQYVSNMGVYYGDENAMFTQLKGIMSLESAGEEKPRMELAVLLYLELYDYIQLSGIFHSSNESASIDRYWVETMYYHVLDECVKDINLEGKIECQWI